MGCALCHSRKAQQDGVVQKDIDGLCSVSLQKGTAGWSGAEGDRWEHAMWM